jgi:hypothetical protein
MPYLKPVYKDIKRNNQYFAAKLKVDKWFWELIKEVGKKKLKVNKDGKKP